ncbi:TIM-barrel domain-containing protein [Lacticaseibacillus nasuensis]|uniref:Glycosyl hydrolase, family 31 n=1 Tax=Lacticaseibacillus nasuensis JCM 17158 TaxID=1291734 RepID=A0A0R1K1F7_9LACO|nr:TIM-barrel domain-containing protein [Lacticaseibacillus nasuensis]KRK73994.1 glycosyl hydrolase, family 31 [Lacticaseibacillus nasuensis JCM 17158]
MFEQTGQSFAVPNAGLRISFITAEIVRVQSLQAPGRASVAVLPKREQTTPITVTQGETLTLASSALTIRVDAAGHVDAYDSVGTPLVIDYRGEMTPLKRDMDAAKSALVEAEGHSLPAAPAAAKLQVVKQLRADEHFYGLGDKTGWLDKRGYVYDNWNTDDGRPHLEDITRLYKSIPFLLGLVHDRAYGLFFDNPYPSHFDLGKESSAYFYYSAAGGELNYYIIGGAGLTDVVRNYTYLTGRTPLPQKWTLGYQQSRFSYETEGAVRDVATHLRELHLPADAIHLDIDYMDGFRVFTVDSHKFPDMKKLTADLLNVGLKTVTIIDPGVKVDPDYAIYKEGIKQHAFATTPKGEVYVNQVWPGDAVYPDFGQSRVRRWWAKNQQILTDLGVSGVWNDMNEPASFRGELPDDTVFSDDDEPSTALAMHNQYAHNMDQATFEGLREQTGKRPFVITRAAYAGTQRYSTVWTGDNRSSWSNLQLLIPQLCNLGLSGFAIAGTDIGGFLGDTTAELLVRWLEAGLFSPLLRNHSCAGTRMQEPWQFDEQTLDLYRQNLQLRYQLIDYLYDLLEAGTRTGLPVMRPLVLHYPDDPQVTDLSSEYLVGQQLLVAPVLMPGETARSVYFPAGDWLDFTTGKHYAGRQTALVQAPLGHLPLFVHADTLLPLRPASEWVDPTTETTLTFKLFGSRGECEHYQDNGSDYAYQQGAYNRYLVKVNATGQASVTFLHRGVTPYQHVTVQTPTQTLQFQLNAAGNQYELVR